MILWLSWALVAQAQQGWTVDAVLPHLAAAGPVHLADADGDGDLDLLVLDAERDWLGWLLQQPDGSFTGRAAVAATPYGLTGVVAPTDLDCDGDLDLVWGEQASPVVARVSYDLGGMQYGHTVDLVGDEVAALDHADVDGDGDPDVLAAHVGAGGFTWFETLDAGGFTAWPVPASAPAEAVRGGDLDGDGDEDLVAVYPDGDRARVAWSDDGVLALERLLDLEIPIDALIADVDADGDLDVAVPGVDAVLVVLESQGDGTFAAREVALEARLDALVSARVDGGGPPEMVGIGRVSGEVQVISLDGGVWRPSRLAEIDHPQGLAVGDLDDDGDADIVVTSLGDGLLVLRQGVDGAFTEELPLPEGVIEEHLAAGDLDGDGDLDLVSVSTEREDQLWAENRGAQGFAHRVLGPGQADHVAVADLDGDGDLDVATASSELDTLVVHLNDGGGDFVVDPAADFDVAGLVAVEAGDVDGDGDDDLVVLAAGGTRLGWIEQATGGLVPHTDFTRGVSGGQHLSVGDVDGDGRLDALIAEGAAGLAVWHGDGSGAFARTLVDPAVLPDALTWGDVDGDGIIDLVAGDTEQDLVWWCRGDGSGAMGACTELAAVVDPERLSLADLHGDKDLDVLVGSSALTGEVVWVVQEAGSFSLEPVVSAQGRSAAVLSVDLTGEGEPEAVVAHEACCGVRIYRDCGDLDSDGDGVFDGCDLAPLDDGWEGNACGDPIEDTGSHLSKPGADGETGATPDGGGESRPRPAQRCGCSVKPSGVAVGWLLLLALALVRRRAAPARWTG